MVCNGTVICNPFREKWNDAEAWNFGIELAIQSMEE